MQRQKGKKIILGLTGSFGSGKTTVARILRSYGALILDADKIAHQCIGRGGSAYKKILSVFGDRILGKDKRIDRRRLAAIVFSDKGLLKKLNKIIHPQVTGIIKENIKRSKKRVIVIDAPLLIESGLHRIADKLIVVKINRAEQLKRIQKKFSLSKSHILKRIKAQIPLPCKVRMADFVIDNNATIRRTKEELDKIRRRLWKS